MGVWTGSSRTAMAPWVMALGVTILAFLTSCVSVRAQSSQDPELGQEIDEEYTAEIREHTTEPFFLTKYVDYLPASSRVPTTMDVLDHIAGAPDVLSYSHEVYEYMRAVADASPRVKVFSVGETEEGREIILVVVSDEYTIDHLEDYKEFTARLADPRTIESDEEMRELISEAKPIYWATGAMHSPETGSPEMLMELVYRLAVDESQFIKEIRDNLIFMTTPILEVDGRDKRVDLLKIKQDDEDARVPRLLYWGKYVAHDNNRDAISLSLELSKHAMRTFLEYHPQVMHDLHESQPHLYTSTGTGPYNPWIDPILINEWHTLAYEEINEMTKMGVPGVWTHGFYDGWAPNYAFYAANGHNSIGRFYETQGAGNADTRRITTGSASNRTWYRPNPPLPSVMWSIRNNVNLQQSALLIAMNYMARNRERFMENFYLKSLRSIEKATTEGPAAYVFPGDDPRPGQAAALLNLMKAQGVEVRRAARSFTVGEQEFSEGSYILRLDQPYSRMIDMMLDRAYFNVNDPRPYDDTGWTLGPLYNAETVRIEDTSILSVHAELVEGAITVPGGVETLTEGETVAYLVNYNAEKNLATFRFDKSELAMEAAEEAFNEGGVKFNAGTFIIWKEGNPRNLEDQLREAGERYGFTAYAVSEVPDIEAHDVSVPRVALMHTWTTTQTEGWVRIALDEQAIPYDYISVHEVRDWDNLKERYDVILFGPSSANATSIVNGLSKTGRRVAWKATDVAPNIGRQDETDDMRGGLELEGVLHLRDFVQQGGVFVTFTSSASLPIHYGLSHGVSIAQTRNLRARGSVYKATFTDENSPIGYGYGDELGVYFSQSPVFRVGRGGSGRGRFAGFAGGGSQRRPSGRGSLDDPDIVQARPRNLGEEDDDDEEESGETKPGRRLSPSERASEEDEDEDDSAEASAQEDDEDEEEPEDEVSDDEEEEEDEDEEEDEEDEEDEDDEEDDGPDPPRVVLQFNDDADDLLISGMLEGGGELAGTAAVVDVPVGEGHIVMFSINPMWRHETHGSFALVFNTILHWDHLDAGSDEEDEDSDEDDEDEL